MESLCPSCHIYAGTRLGAFVHGNTGIKRALAYMQARAQKYHLEEVSTTFGVPARMCGHAPSKYHLESKVPHSAEYKYMQNPGCHIATVSYPCRAL